MAIGVDTRATATFVFAVDDADVISLFEALRGAYPNASYQINPSGPGAYQISLASDILAGLSLADVISELQDFQALLATQGA